MPTNKVNNNIKLKSGGGLINDATDGLSVDGEYVSDNAFWEMTASTNIKYSADTERSSNIATAVKVKEFRVLRAGGVKVYGDCKIFNSPGVANFSVDLYVNGSYVKTLSGELNPGVTTYTTYNADLTGLKMRDLVQIYITSNYSGGSYQIYVKNVKIAFDKSLVENVIVVTD